ncbi:toll/interleukin-1 receptor domain-containing protein [Streptomyces platensis]|uniref:toll/interleukin-1 receptor domain-containing protein n=1 Tax=Streptomyces platensis TaxID=58346 RepID=UPI0038686867|nr:TIR domain-containing protein [Streptomyces platensis]
MERDAFISYSHKRDVPLAEALQKGLHGILRTPWLRRPGVKVFRDTTSLAASHDLGGSIKAALSGARYFIYLASPEAAESRWVREEIQYWRHNHGMEQFLVALSDGNVAWDPIAGDFDWSLTNALPPELRGAFATEPLWVDLRAFRDADDRSMAPGSVFRDKVASLAAPLHRLPKEALDSTDLLMQRKAVRILRFFVATLAVSTLAAAGAGVFAWQQREEALARARTSASQALAARALETVDKDPRKAAQFALYAQAVKPTGESAQALSQAVAANGSVARHLQAGNEEVADEHGLTHDAATKVAISRDKGVLAYYSDFDPDAYKTEDHIHLYDIGAGKALPTLKGAGWPLGGGGMELSADGRSLAVEGAYNQIGIWDVAHHKLRRTITASDTKTLPESSKGLGAFAFSGDGRRVAATFHSPDQTDQYYVAVWDAATGRLLTKERATPNALTLTFDRSNRLIALDTQAGTTRTLDRDSTSWNNQHEIPGLPYEEPPQVTLLAGGSKAYLGGHHELWDLTKGRRLGHTDDRGSDLVVMPTDGKEGAVYAANGQEVGVYNTALHRQQLLGSFTWPVSSISASGDGHWLAAGSQDGAVSLFSTTDFRTGVPLANGPKLKPDDLAPDQRTAYRTGISGTEVWTITGGGVRRLGHVPLRVSYPSGEEDGLVASPDGNRAMVAREGTLSLWDLRTGRRIGRQQPGHAGFKPLAFLRDGTHVLGATQDEVKVVSTESWKVLQSVPFDSTDFDTGAPLSADRTTLALVEDEKLVVWRWDGTEKEMKQVRQVSIAPVWTLSGHEVVVSAKGERVAVKNGDALISLLDVSTGKFVQGTSASSGGMALAFSSDTAFLVQDGAGLQFWDTDTGESRGTWTLPKNQDSTTMRLLTNNDGTMTALGSNGSLVRRTIDVAAWQKVLCNLMSDELPQKEYDRYLKGLDVDAPCHR